MVQNPGMGIGVSGKIPTGDNLTGSDRISFDKSLEYMGFKPGEKIKGKKVDYVFIGSCHQWTNRRFQTLRQLREGEEESRFCNCLDCTRF